VNAPATLPLVMADGRARLGFALGLLGVLAFSLTLPMTRMAVAVLDPAFVAFGRMAGAGMIACIALRATAAPFVERSQIGLLVAAAVGVVLGFPLLSSFAMKTLPSSHGAVIVGIVPLATAFIASLWFGERHRARFWICAALGTSLVIAFAVRGGSGGIQAGDVWLLMSVVLGAVGYAAGGHLAASIGGVNTILWALAIALPLTLPVCIWLMATTPMVADARAWSGFAYVTLVSQLAGFFAWYNGLALGGVGAVSQVQLLQVFFTLAFAAALFGEHVGNDAWMCALAVAVTILVGRLAQQSR
jgi:drug/metabolite transporter (DMT)-like permease